MKVIAIVGPTASSKSELAVALAERIGAEIISVDSMQVYRGMDIGTAKAPAALRARVPHHMLDLCEPEAEYAVAEFQAAGRSILAELSNGGVPAIIVGGSGLHFRALVDPLIFPPTDRDLRSELEGLAHLDLVAELIAADPDAAEQIDLANPRRVIRAVEVHRLTGRTPSERAADKTTTAVRTYTSEIPFLAIGLDPAGALPTRAEQRIDRMVKLGLVEEVAAVAPRLGMTAGQAIGYKEFLPVVSGEVDVGDATLAALRATQALAKRQRTFFRRDPRIEWLPWQDDEVRRRKAAWVRIEEAAEWIS